MKKTFITVAVFITLFTGCAALKNPQAIARTAIETSNVALNLATKFYTDQLVLCSQVPATQLCHFSAAGLITYQQNLLAANKGFSIAVETADTYKSAPTAANESAMTNATTDLKSKLAGVKTQ